MKITRREFIKGTVTTGAFLAAGGAGVLFTPRRAHAFVQSPNLAKFGAGQLLRDVGTGIPVAGADSFVAPVTGVTHYTIGINQFQDQLHPSLGPTTLWGYHPAAQPPGSALPQRHLGGIIAVKKGTPIQITFQNNLPSTNIIPVDTTIPGANQAQNRTAVHLHGGFVPWISDGGPFDWWTPSALQTDPVSDGTHGLSFLNNQVLNPLASAGQAEYYYPNDQSARLMWYHDHAFGITRTNAYAGIASGYVIYDDYELGLVTSAGLPGPLDPRTKYLIFQDKIFVDSATIATLDPTWAGPTSTGSLWYAHVYDPLRWLLGPTPSGPPPDPSVIPEFFGDTILVNGTVYPSVTLEQRQYRFRMLNACNARFLNPRLVYAQGATGTKATEPATNKPGPAFIQIGTEGGFLPAPAMVNGPKQPLLLLAPAERADLIVDLRAVPAGSVLILYSDAPAPFPVGDPRNDYYPGNPKTPASIVGFGPNTRTLLQIKVKAIVGAADPAITMPASNIPGIEPFLVTQTPGVPTPNPVGIPVRPLTLNEAFDSHGRLIQYLGTNVATGVGGPGLFGRQYETTPTEIVSAGATEIWEIANLTGDTHPIHFHLVNVQILSRQAFNAKQYAGVPNYNGKPFAPDPNELGWKETVRMNPGEVTRVIMKFTLPVVTGFTVPSSPRIDAYGMTPQGKTSNEYVWHCHILEHEEHDMMRPLVVFS